MNPLAKLSQATTALAEARTLEEIKAIRDMAEQARLYAQANKLGLDAINAGTEIRLRADRKMGEVLIQAKETGEISQGKRKNSDDSRISLSDVGVSFDQSSTAQQLAKLSEQVFEQRIEATKVTNQRLTTGRVLVQPEVRAEKIERINQGNVSLSTVTRYPVVYADPPWRYEHSRTDNRQIENHYPTMALEEICNLPVSELAADDAVLFLWATSPKLAESMEVIPAWGFTYRTCIVWDKERVGMGYYARQQHELLLIAARGNLPVPEPANRPASVLRLRRDNEHSSKPLEFYDLIERMYPEYKKIELFARNQREGWQAWGNQA